jgi:Flp pilus assembly CpaE family ATPase
VSNQISLLTQESKANGRVLKNFIQTVKLLAISTAKIVTVIGCPREHKKISHKDAHNVSNIGFLLIYGRTKPKRETEGGNMNRH